MAAQPPSDRPSWLPEPPPAAAPPPPPPAAFPAPEQAAPAYGPPAGEFAPPAEAAWNPPAPARSNSSLTLVAGGVLLALVAGGGWMVHAQMSSNDQAPAAAVASPSPSPILSDYERADRFLNVDLAPPLAQVGVAIPAVQKSCTSKLPPSCKDALITMNKAMVAVDAAIATNRNDVPVCIARPVQQFQYDWQGMEQGISQAIGGFNAGSRTLIISGLVTYTEIAKYLKPDVDRINKARATCSKTV